MRTIAASTLLALGLVASAEAAPKVVIAADDGGMGFGDGTLKLVQTGLQKTGAFAVVDVIDTSATTPTVNQLKMYDGVVTWAYAGYADATGFGNNLADYVDAGGGVVVTLFGLDSGENIAGRFDQGSYWCILPDFSMFSNGNPLKNAPNDPQSPLVQGVKSISTDLNISPTMLSKGASSVWDWQDGASAVCKTTINGHPRVDLNYYPSMADVLQGAADSITLIKNALLFVSNGFNPMKGLPNPSNFPNTAVGAVSNAQTITYTNTSMAQQTLTSLTVGGANAGDFIITKAPQLPLVVASMGTFTVDVEFQPLAGGARSATLKAGVMNQMSTGDVALAGNAVPAAIKVTPYPIAFGGTQINMPLMKQITIANQGMAKVNVQNVTITMGQAQYSLSQFAFPVALVGGGSFPMTVTFNPQGNGTFPGQLTVTSDDPNAPMLNVPISGCAGPSGIALDSNAIAFGSVNLGASVGQQVNVTNSGCADLHVTDITVSGANPTDFTVNKMMAVGTIGAQQSQAFTISFKPTMQGQRAATITVLSDAGNNAVNVFGNGTTSMLTLAPMMLDLGASHVGKPSMPKTVAVGNVGNGTLKVMSVDFGGPDGASFSLSGMPVPPFTVAGGQMQNVSVICTPSKIGMLSGTMTVTTDVGPGTVDLACTGTAPQQMVAPAMLDFGMVNVMTKSKEQAITITNKGTDDLHVDTIAINGMDSADFNSNDLPMMLPLTVAPNGTFTFHVYFQPSNNAVEHAEVDINSDDPMSPMVVVPLTGTGIQKQITVMPMTVDFGSVMIGTMAGPKTVTITNSGDGAITIDTVSIGGPAASSFAIDMKGPITIDAGKSADVKVTFSPLAAGAAKATLSIADMTDMLPTVMIALTGTGAAPALTLNPATVDFGPIPVGMTSMASTITVKNAGTGPVAIDTIKSSDPTFTVDDSMTMKMLAGGMSTTFTVTYAPTAAVMNNGKVNLTLKNTTTPIASITVSGSGEMMSSRGCGCRVGERAPSSGAPSIALALLVAGLVLRRRRRG